MSYATFIALLQWKNIIKCTSPIGNTNIVKNVIYKLQFFDMDIRCKEYNVVQLNPTTVLIEEVVASTIKNKYNHN